MLAASTNNIYTAVWAQNGNYECECTFVYGNPTFQEIEGCGANFWPCKLIIPCLGAVLVTSMRCWHIMTKRVLCLLIKPERICLDNFFLIQV